MSINKTFFYIFLPLQKGLLWQKTPVFFGPLFSKKIGGRFRRQNRGIFWKVFVIGLNPLFFLNPPQNNSCFLISKNTFFDNRCWPAVPPPCFPCPRYEVLQRVGWSMFPFSYWVEWHLKIGPGLAQVSPVCLPVPPRAPWYPLGDGSIDLCGRLIPLLFLYISSLPIFVCVFCIDKWSGHMCPSSPWDAYCLFFSPDFYVWCNWASC